MDGTIAHTYSEFSPAFSVQQLADHLPLGTQLIIKQTEANMFITLDISTKLLQSKAKEITELATKYSDKCDWAISDLLAEHEFNSMMRARLVNRIVNMRSNVQIAKAVDECAKLLPDAFPAPDRKAIFADAYDREVIKFRNKLAHVKQLNAQNPVLIGEINGIEYKCDAEFCKMIRNTLIRYGNWFEAINEKLAE